MFDGAWRLLSGQVPMRDFFLPEGIVPSLMQAAVFGVSGVSWFAYCMHAAILNGLFAVVVYAILRRFDGPAIVSAFFGTVAAIVFYPPFGVPYPDQHAFFFSLCLIYAAMRAVARESRENDRRIWQASIPFLALCAIFSKPLPSGAVVAGIGVWLMARALTGEWRPLATVLIVSVGCLLLASAAVVLLGMPIKTLFCYGYQLPAGEMRWRLGNISTWRGLYARHARVWPQVRQRSPILIHLAGLAILLAWCWPRVRAFREQILRATQAWILAECLLGVTLLFIYLTNNQPRNGIALQPLAVGLACVATLVCSRAAAATKGGAAIAAALAVPFVIVAAADAWSFNEDANALRTVNDQAWVADSPPVTVPPPMDFMRLNEAWRWSDFTQILPVIQKRPENFFLIGDSSILYGASGKPSILPVLWLHIGVTVPPPGSPEFADLERRLLKNLERYDVRFVVLEGQMTWTGISLGSLPRVQALVTGCPSSSVGGWTILEICH